MSTTTLAAPVSRLGSLQAVTAFLAGTGLLQTIAALATLMPNSPSASAAHGKACP